MVSLRFRIFVLPLLVVQVFFVFKDTTSAHAQQVPEAGSEFEIIQKLADHLKGEKVNSNAGAAFGSAVEEASGKIGGRKSMMRKKLQLIKREEGVIIKEEESKISGATLKKSVGKCNNNVKGKSKTLCKLGSFRRSNKQGEKVKMGGFMAFNADYHMARPHPPKNN